jgi:hypothetical protein
MAWQERAAGEALQLATLFQGLGYFGRCSFDAVLIGRDERYTELHWVECNGRWGGVSIPMTLANRLTGDWTRTPPVIIERVALHGRRHPLQELLDGLRDELYRAGGPGHGLVILSPGRIEQGTGFEALVLDRSVSAARTRAHWLEKRLLRAIGALERDDANS